MVTKKPPGVPLRWVIGVALGIVVITVFVLAAIEQDHDRPWEAVITVLALGAAALATWLGLDRGRWASNLRELLDAVHDPGRSVAQVRDGRTAVGHAVHVGARHLVTVPAVVNRALHREEEDSTRPAPGAQVEVVFRTDGSNPFLATVTAWGPSRPLRPNVVVLRTTKRLPGRIPHLKPARRPHSGTGRLLLPGPGGETHPGTGTERAPGATAVEGKLGDRRITIHRTLPPDVAGAPVLPTAPENPGTEPVLALLSSDTNTGDDHPGPERSFPLTDADEIRAVLRPVVRRRTLLRAATGVGLATIAGGYLAAEGILARPPVRLRGAGWDGLFRDPHVQEYLRRKGDLDATDVARLSGVKSLHLTRADLDGLDFITCPNRAIAAFLSEKANGLHSGQPTTPVTICTEPMVLLVHAGIRKGLTHAGLLVHVAGDSQVRFDLKNYLRGYGRVWRHEDPDFPYRLGGKSIDIGFSDPAQTGGGLMYLSALDYVQGLLGTDRSAQPIPATHLQPEWLWSKDGPMSWTGPPATMELTNTLRTGDQDMVFTYEHEAISFLLNNAPFGEYVLLGTSPEVKVTQYLLPLTKHGRDLADLLDEEEDLAEILVRHLHLRVPKADRVDNELRKDPLRQCVWGLTGNEPEDPGGLKAVKLQVDRMRELLDGMLAAAKAPL